MADTIFESIYPLTITVDRYTGAYSGGRFTAWNLEPNEVPTEPFEDDVSCMDFWYGNRNGCVVGVGNTVEAAVANLYILLRCDTNEALTLDK